MQRSDKSNEKLIDSEVCIVLDLLILANVDYFPPISKPESIFYLYFSPMQGVEISHNMLQKADWYDGVDLQQ